MTTSLVRNPEVPEAPEILEEAIRELRGTDGFRGLLILARNDEGASVSISVWKDEQSARASETTAARLRRETDRFGRIAQTVETFPVVAFETG